MSRTDPAVPERNKRIVLTYFDEYINSKDLTAIDRTMTADVLDHDGPGGRPTDRDGNRPVMAALHRLYPDLGVEVRDALAEGDKVAVRNVWTGTNVQTGRRIKFHGFVM